MSHQFTAVLLVCFLVFAFGSTAFAQEVKKGVKKETKPSVINDAKKEAKPAVVGESNKDLKKPTKPRTMKWTSCSQTGCGFWAKSYSAKELRYILKRHSKKYHKIELTDNQLKDMVKKEGVK